MKKRVAHRIKRDTTFRGVRDADYRGQSTGFDWSKLVYMVRRGRPNALAVLQDAIHQYFGRQFERAQREAKEKDRVTYYYDNYEREQRAPAKEHLVLFLPNIARARFRNISDPRSLPTLSPLDIVSAESYRTGYLLSGYWGQKNAVVVWSSRTGNTVRKHLLRRRLLRPDFPEQTAKGVQWHIDTPRHVRSLVRRDARHSSLRRKFG